MAITMLTEMTRKKILNGQLQDKLHHLHGTPEGYPFVLYKADKITVYVNAWKEGIADLREPIEFLKSVNAEGVKKLEVHQDGYSLVATYSSPLKFVDSVNTLFTPLFAYLKENGYVGCCGQCGKLMGGEEPIEYYNVNNHGLYLCPECAGQIEESLKEYKAERKAETSNLLPGIGGAFIGSLAGVAAWLLIAQLGFVSAISGFLMAFCAFYMYEKFGKALDLKGVIACVVIVLLMVYVANHLTWVIAVYKELKNYGYTFGDVFKQLGMILKQVDLVKSYRSDLAIGYLLTVVGTAGIVITKFREQSGSYTFKKK